VSHDRHLLRTVADELYVVHGGTAEPFDGDLEDYAKWLADTDAASSSGHALASAPGAAPVTAPTEAKREAETAAARKQRKREEAERRNRLTPLRAAVEKCEREIERLTKERAEIEAQLQSPELYADGGKDRLRKLTETQGRIARELADTEAQWLEYSER